MPVFAFLLISAFIHGAEVLREEEPHVGHCRLLLSDAETRREILGPSEDEVTLLKYILLATRTVREMEARPSTLVQHLDRLGMRELFALVNFVRTVVAPSLERYDQNAVLRRDYEQDEELMSLAEDERQTLRTEIQTHRAELLRLAERAIYPAAGGAVYVEIRPVAGQTLDWAEIPRLSKMYLALARQMGWRAEVVIEQVVDGDVRAMGMRIEGPLAQRWLVPERGVHRLRRFGDGSTLGSKRKPHFHFVEVVAYAEPARTEFTLDPDGLEFQTFRTGAGGERAHEMEYGVRARDVASGLEVAVQIHRSQRRNKEVAADLLRARLYARHHADARRAPEVTEGRYVRTYDFVRDPAEAQRLMDGNLRGVLEERGLRELITELGRRVAGEVAL